MKKKQNDHLEVMTDPMDLVNLAKEGKSVYIPKWKRRSPAALFLAWQFKMVLE